MTTVFLCLGSNLGDRQDLLKKACAKLDAHANCHIQKMSLVYETEPWGVTDQNYYFNQVVEIETHLTPKELLILCHKIESELDRQRDGSWSPRTLDIDILIFGSIQIEEPDFHVPHRHLHERRFALVPLVEIAPDVLIPGSGKTAAQMLTACRDTHRVQPLE